MGKLDILIKFPFPSDFFLIDFSSPLLLFDQLALSRSRVLKKCGMSIATWKEFEAAGMKWKFPLSDFSRKFARSLDFTLQLIFNFFPRTWTFAKFLIICEAQLIIHHVECRFDDDFFRNSRDFWLVWHSSFIFSGLFLVLDFYIEGRPTTAHSSSYAWSQAVQVHAML